MAGQSGCVAVCYNTDMSLKQVSVILGSIVLGSAIVLGGLVLNSSTEAYQEGMRTDSGLEVSGRSEPMAVATSSAPAGSISEDAETEELSKDLMASYMKLKAAKRRSGTTSLTRAEKERLTREVRKTLEEHQRREIKRYEASDFTFAEPTRESVKRYGNYLGGVMAKYSPADAPNEAQVIISALEGNNPAKLTQLDPIITAFEKIRDAYAGITIPRDAATKHARLTTSVSRHLENLKGFRHFRRDAVDTLVSIKRYRRDATEMKRAIRDLIEYFREHDVSFQQDEPGSVFINTL